MYSGNLATSSLMEKYPEHFEDTLQMFHGGVSCTQVTYMGEMGERLAATYKAILGED